MSHIAFPPPPPRLASTVVLALVASLAVALPSPAADVIRIESATLEKVGLEVRLHLLASAPPQWRIQSDSHGNVVLSLPGSILTVDPTGLVAPTGLISQIEFRSAPATSAPESTIVIRTSHPPTYSVTTDGNHLTLALRPVPAPLDGDPSGDLIIGPGDLLSIEIFGFDELSRKVRVMRDGTVTLPLMGTLSLTGLSLQVAEQRIANLLTEGQFVSDPQVAIYLEEVVSRAITVQGGVASPGIYPLRGRRTLLEMLGEAGGLVAGERAPGMIVILRDNKQGLRDRIDVDAERLMSLEDLALNIELEPGDIIMVPQPRLVRIYVAGEVASPGPVEFLISEGLTIFQAITAAGGPTDRANLSKVFVNRQLGDGTIKRCGINDKDIRKGKLEDFALEADDIVIIKQSSF